MSKTACRLLKYLLPGHSREEVMTNFEQLYEIMITEKGTIYAKFWIWLQVFRSIPGFISASFYWKYTIFRSYMKIAYRNLLRNKVYAFINIFGLAVGMACCIVIFLFVQHEFSYDDFHENADRIYRLNSERKYPTGRVWYSTTSRVLDKSLLAEIPEIINTVRHSIKRNILSYGDLRSEERLWYVDPGFFEIFTFPLVIGDAKTTLNDPNNIVISEKAANKYFDDKNPIGEFFRIDDKFDFRITGVMKNIPDNSSFKADFIASYISLKSIEGIKYFNKSCGYYFLLSEDASIDDIENKFYDYYVSNNTDKMSKVTEFYLEPLKSIHLSPFNARGGDMNTIYPG